MATYRRSKRCVACGHFFYYERSTAKYCSDACRKRAQRGEHFEGELYRLEDGVTLDDLLDDEHTETEQVMPSGTAAAVLAAMEAYDLKSDGTGKYRSNSPFRPGSNSHGFTLTIDSPEHGAYFDHVSQESGSLYELARRLGIEIGPPPVTSTKRAYKGLEDYATTHGVSAEVLRNAGWSETKHQGRPALKFRTATGPRWRFLDGVKPHYISPKGYQRSWYGLTSSAARELADGGYLVITNGEISTVAGRHYGLAAASVTGGEKAIPPDLLQELKTFLGDNPPPILVAFDCDDTGRRAGVQVAQQLRDSGLIARAVDLGLGKGGDLADFCMLHGSKTGQVLYSLPALTLDKPGEEFEVPRGWYIIHASELRNLPPIEWIVPGEIPERGVTVLFGPSGAGKSFLALDYALNIAQADPVLYMAGEGEYGYRQRVAAWCEHHGKTEGHLYMSIGAVQVMESGDLNEFLAVNAAIKPRIVIIDTMARSMVGADENSTRDMGMFIRACEQIKRALDSAVLIIHHTNKGGVYERGNSALRGASDAMIKITADDDLIIVESAKTKDAQPFQTRYMKLLPVSVDMDGQQLDSAVMVEADKVVQTPDDPLTPNQEKVLRMLVDEEHGASRTEIAEATNVPYHSLQRILVRLRKLGFIEQPARNSPYQITDAGRQRVGVDRVDPVDRPFLQSDNNDEPDQARSSRSSRSLREEVDRIDRPEDVKATQSGNEKADQGAPETPLSDQSGNVDRSEQAELIPADRSPYYEEAL